MTSRGARTVAKEMADWLEYVEGELKKAGIEPGDSLKEPVYLRHLRRWIVALCPPRKSPRVISKGVKARRASVRELDKLCREIVFLRDKNQCRHCGMAAGKLDWAHVYSRRFHSTRWALDGSMVLCRACHLWWHHAPTEATAWWAAQVGPRTAEHLEALRRLTKTDLNLVKLYLEAEKKKLEAK